MKETKLLRNEFLFLLLSNPIKEHRHFLKKIFVIQFSQKMHVKNPQNINFKYKKTKRIELFRKWNKTLNFTILKKQKYTTKRHSGRILHCLFYLV